MAYLVLARKWRPQGFEAVIGQEHVTRTLKNAIASSRIAHAFLFSGPRGVGKTTTARILAKALNCEQGPRPEPCNQCALCREISSGSSLDIIEIDGASNNSVDDIRDLRERVRYTPTRAKYKVYIIDEVHMLSTSAFNALLKTLEEPPPHIIFVLATTEPQKIPVTILSRCQHFAFRRIPAALIVANLKEITGQEGVKINTAALAQIARSADGSLRDAQSILEQVISYGDEVSEETVLDLLGVLDRRLLEQVSGAILGKNASQALLLLDQVINSGYNLGAFQQQLLEYFRNLLVAKICGDESLLEDLPVEERAQLIAQAEKAGEEELSLIIKLLLEAGELLKRAPQPRVVLELYLVRLAQLSSLAPLSQILERLLRLEQKPGAQGIAQPGAGKTASEPQLSLGYNPKGVSKIEAPSKPGQTSVGAPSRSETSHDYSQQDAAPTIQSQNNHDHWERVVAAVGQSKKPLAAVLWHGALIELQGDTARIAFDSSIWRQKVEEKENKEVLLAALKQCFQRPLKLEVMKDSLEAGLSLAEHKESVGQEEGLKLQEQALAEPLVTQAMDIFQASLLEVKAFVT